MVKLIRGGTDLITRQGFQLGNPGNIASLEEINFVGMDLVEVSPPYDHAEITSMAAATVAHDWICIMADKQRKKS